MQEYGRLRCEADGTDAVLCTGLHEYRAWGRTGGFVGRSGGGLVLRISVGLECDGGADWFAVRIQVHGGQRCDAM